MEVAVAPAPELRFRRRIHPLRSLRDLWGARELLQALAEREFEARYAQTVLVTAVSDRCELSDPITVSAAAVSSASAQRAFTGSSGGSPGRVNDLNDW